MGLRLLILHASMVYWKKFLCCYITAHYYPNLLFIRITDEGVIDLLNRQGDTFLLEGYEEDTYSQTESISPSNVGTGYNSDGSYESVIIQSARTIGEWTDFFEVMSDEEFTNYITEVTEEIFVDSNSEETALEKPVLDIHLTYPPDGQMQTIACTLLQVLSTVNTKKARHFIEILTDLYEDEVTTQNKLKLSALHMACLADNPDTLKLLLEQEGIGLEAFFRDKTHKNTPLHYAAQCGSIECVEILVEYRDNLNKRFRDKIASNIRNEQGLVPADMTENQTIKALLSSKQHANGIQHL